MNHADSQALKLLRDINLSARRIIGRLEGVRKIDFSNPDNLDAQDIVARRLSIIGEAAAALLKKHAAFCEMHPEIPLRKARGLRNIIIHDYDGVDWDTVWNTVKHDLPELVEVIAPFIFSAET